MPDLNHYRWAATWWASILVTVPIARPIVRALRDANLLRFSVVLTMLIGVALSWHALRAMWTLQPAKAWFFILYLLGGAVAAHLLLHQPEERLHLVQYGVLGGLLLHASGAASLRTIGMSIGLGTVAGWSDEMVQYMLPTRVYDLRDVAINSVSCGFGAVARSICGFQRE